MVKTLSPTLPPEAKLLAQKALGFTETVLNTWAWFTFGSAKLKTNGADSVPASLTLSTSYDGRWDQWAEVKAVLKALVTCTEGAICHGP